MKGPAAASAFRTPAPELHGRDCACLQCQRSRCPDCGAEIEEKRPFGSFIERFMVAFLRPEDREQAERMVELSCRECGWYAVAEAA